MPYIVDRYSAPSRASGTSWTADLKPHLEDDVVIIFITPQFSSMTTPTDFTLHATSSNSNRMYAWGYRAGATPKTSISSTVNSSNTYVTHQVVVIRGAPASYLDASATRASGGSTGCIVPAVTTSTDNCLILSSASLSGGTYWANVCPDVGPSFLDQIQGNTGDHSQGGCWSFQQTADTTDTYKFIYAAYATNHNANGITLAIKDDGTGYIPGYAKADSAANKPALMLNRSSRAYESGELASTQYNPTALWSTINSETTVQAVDSHDTFLRKGMRSLKHETTGTTDVMSIGASELVASIDIDNEIICVSTGYSGGGFPEFSKPAIVIGFADGTNGRLWSCGGSDAVPNVAKGIFPTLIEIGGGFELSDEDVGTFDPTDVDKIVYGNYTAEQFEGQYFGPVYKLQTMIMLGGSSALPCDMASCLDAAKASLLNTVQDQSGQTTGQFYCLQNITIGDGGTTDVDWDSTQQSVEYPGASDVTASTPRPQAQISSASLTFKIDAGTGNSVVIQSQVFSMGDFHNHVVTSGSVTGGSNVIIAATPTVGVTDAALGGWTWTGCKEMTLTGDLSGGCTIDSCPDAQSITLTGATEAALQAKVDAIANCTFTNNLVAVRVEFTGTGDVELDFDNITWTSNTTDIHYNATSSSALTAVMENGSDATTTAISGSATSVTISAPVISLTVTSSEASSDIKIFNTGTQTIDASTTGTTVSTTTAATYDWTVQKSGFIPQRGTAVVLGSSNVTVNVTLVEDAIYTASHGLTFTTDYSYDASTRIMTIVANQEGRDLYSALVDDFISETSLRNCPFPLFAVGPDRIDFTAVGYYNSATTVGATIDSGDITFWKGAGMDWEHDTTGNPTKKFYSIKSSNTLQTGSVVGYTQVVTGTASECTLVSDKVNQVIQYFEDTNGDGTADYEYTGHLLFKGFKTGYYQARWDTVNDGGVTTLESYEYNISLLQSAIAGTTGDQSITIATLTDHTSSPLAVGGKNFDYELVDPGTNSGADLLSQLNYDAFTAVDASISGTIYTSYKAFDLPDMIAEAGSTLETEYGHFEGDGAVGDFSGVYISRSSADHPDMGRFQSNDGTYYTPATVAQLSAPNVTAGRIQICNATGAGASAWQASTVYSEGDYALPTTGKGSDLGDGTFFVCTTPGTSGGSEPTWDTTDDGDTTADNTVVWTVRPTEFDNAVTTSGYSTSWTDGEHFAAGDTIRLRWVDEDDLEIISTGIATSDGTTTFLNTPEDDTVYDSYGIDGSTVTEYSADFPNVQVDISDPDNVFYIDRFYAWHKYNLTTEDGIRNFFGAVTAGDTSNITINNSVVDIYFDNTKAVSARQGDNIVIQRADGAYPQVTTTSGGGGLGFYYTGIGYSTSSGSGLDTTERNKLLGLYDYDPTANALEGSLTYQQAQRIMLAESAGKVAVAGSTVTFRDQADSKNRISATVDANGQRTSVTVDGT